MAQKQATKKNPKLGAQVLELLEKGPLTCRQISEALGQPPQLVALSLGGLKQAKLIHKDATDDERWHLGPPTEDPGGEEQAPKPKEEPTVTTLPDPVAQFTELLKQVPLKEANETLASFCLGGGADDLAEIHRRMSNLSIDKIRRDRAILLWADKRRLQIPPELQEEMKVAVGGEERDKPQGRYRVTMMGGEPKVIPSGDLPFEEAIAYAEAMRERKAEGGEGGLVAMMMPILTSILNNQTTLITAMMAQKGQPNGESSLITTIMNQNQQHMNTVIGLLEGRKDTCAVDGSPEVAALRLQVANLEKEQREELRTKIKELETADPIALLNHQRQRIELLWPRQPAGGGTRPEYQILDQGLKGVKEELGGWRELAATMLTAQAQDRAALGPGRTPEETRKLANEVIAQAEQAEKVLDLEREFARG